MITINNEWWWWWCVGVDREDSWASVRDVVGGCVVGSVDSSEERTGSAAAAQHPTECQAAVRGSILLHWTEAVSLREHPQGTHRGTTVRQGGTQGRPGQPTKLPFLKPKLYKWCLLLYSSIVMYLSSDIYVAQWAHLVGFSGPKPSNESVSVIKALKCIKIHPK